MSLSVEETKARQRAASQRLRDARKAAGVCAKCGKPAERLRCRECYHDDRQDQLDEQLPDAAIFINAIRACIGLDPLPQGRPTPGGAATKSGGPVIWDSWRGVVR